uniref:Uncharacterized protein n=1 Tax=Amphilophus citrinellus TaxID=61819 RepID=A0A3Q0S7Q1_AMPCI
MGILKLQKLINDLSLYEEVNIGKTGIIVDGNALYYSLYYKSDPKLDQRCGGDYPGFKDEVCKFFQTLQDCEVTPYVILDGGSGSEKQKTLRSRLKWKVKYGKKIAESKPGDTLPEGCNVLPPLVKDVFIEVLKEKGIAFKQCLGEADPEVVSAANLNQCAVLSIDADFCIYDLHKGFLHLHNFEWKRKEDGNVPAKLFTRSKFCEHFKLDPALMPVFASIAGNDYSRLGEDMFANESSSSGDFRIDRLHNTLDFLKDVNVDGLDDSEKRERALSAALNHVGESEDETFKLSIQKYVEPGKTSSQLPLWMLGKVEHGELTSFITSVVDQKTMMLPALVEDFSQPSSYTAAYRIRQYFYGLLLGNEQCTEYDGVNKRDVQPILPNVSSDEREKLQLQCLNEAPEDLRLRVFEEALKVQTSALKNIPDHLKLPVCVTIFWFKRLQHHPKCETADCLHALLLGFVFDSEQDEFERRMKALKDEGMRRKLQPPVAHAFSQWQCCMRQSLHLNQLLCSPLPEPQCSRLYCGPLLHRLAEEHMIEELEDTLTGEKKKFYVDLKTICHLLAKKKTLIIGDSILRNVKLEIPATVLKHLPEATAGDIEDHLKGLAQEKRTFDKIIIHVGRKDIQMHQLEVTKSNIESVCNFAKTMSYSVVFSGPLPNRTNADVSRSMLSFNHWLSEWCPENNVGFIDNWKTFWVKPGLIGRDGIHPTLKGAALISRNLSQFILNPESRGAAPKNPSSWRLSAPRPLTYPQPPTPK